MANHEILLDHAGNRDRDQHGGTDLAESRCRRTDFMAQLFDPRTLAGFVLYGGAAVLYIVALRRIPMSVALPCTAASYVAAALIGHYLFAEPLGPARLGAIALICLGVVLLAAA